MALRDKESEKLFPQHSGHSQSLLSDEITAFHSTVVAIRASPGAQVSTAQWSLIVHTDVSVKGLRTSSSQKSCLRLQHSSRCLWSFPRGPTETTAQWFLSRSNLWNRRNCFHSTVVTVNVPSLQSSLRSTAQWSRRVLLCIFSCVRSTVVTC